MRSLTRRFVKFVTATCLLAVSGGALAAPPAPIEGEMFESWVGRYPDMTTRDLLKHWDIGRLADAPLRFKPSAAAFHAHVVKALSLSKEAVAQLEKDGLVIMPQTDRYSMAAALYRIYTADMPLLVTTDSILDAMHRSFDSILTDLEVTVLRAAVKDALFTAQMALPDLARREPSLAVAAQDADLYLSVALNLLESEPNHGSLLMAPRLSAPADVKAILTKVHSLKLENPGLGGDSTPLYGRSRAVDWSQFKPRGHYTESVQLERYFRAMMWLGRADTGFEADDVRQLRAASVLTRVMDESGASKRMGVVRNVVELMVGRADNLGPDALLPVLRDQKLLAAGALGPDKAITELADVIAASNLAGQRIRSQYVVSLPEDPKKTELPPVFQLFGQAFILDSFVLSKVVYDDILFKGKKQERRMPTGLDVMAALGSDEATRLLMSELDAWNYAQNLATLRDVIESWSGAHWQDNLYSMWLDALRSLNETPTGNGVPEVMKGTAWARKMTQTQLASWAQLRHDTILYAKQSETASVGCVYPVGYVEPYLAFYEKLGRFAGEARRRFKGLESAGVQAEQLERYMSYFENFETTMTQLRTLAGKELAGRPFTKTEEQFLKNTIEKTDAGTAYFATPEWNGWYVKLIFIRRGVEKDAIDAHPTIADVHTDPDAGKVLEVGTGNVDLTVAAIDNHGDRAIYVGPTFSYYEFTQPASDRLTDPQWEAMLSSPNKAPARPAWLQPYLGK
ncbi:MAG: DUF3160 domain-containing protein [Myxococcales bacterium]|nr:DUF3160 domain-containing protein [Myxococcales bacterium]